MTRARILTLDDQPAAMEYWWDALKDAEYELVTTSDVDDAITIFRNEPYINLLLLDRMMTRGNKLSAASNGNAGVPDIDTGYLTYQYFRNTLKFSAPIIILTNYYESAEAEQWENDDEYGNLKVVPKTILPSELVELVDEMLSKVKPVSLQTG